MTFLKFKSYKSLHIKPKFVEYTDSKSKNLAYIVYINEGICAGNLCETGNHIPPLKGWNNHVKTIENRKYESQLWIGEVDLKSSRIEK